MFVTDCLSGGQEYPSEKAREMMIHGHGSDDFPNESINQMRVVSGLCNAAEFDASTANQPIHMRKIFGDPTDQAILRLSETLCPVNELRNGWKKDFEIAFNSKNKFMIRIMSTLGSPNSAQNRSVWNQCRKARITTNLTIGIYSSKVHPTSCSPVVSPTSKMMATSTNSQEWNSVKSRESRIAGLLKEKGLSSWLKNLFQKTSLLP